MSEPENPPPSLIGEPAPEYLPQMPARSANWPTMDELDAQLVADEVARLRGFGGQRDGHLRVLQADMLEQVPTALAVEFLRELALRAIADMHGESWMVSAVLQAEVHRELRQGRRRAGKYLGGPPA